MASMKIYTRTGDQGLTGLFGGARVRKNDVRVEAYGTVDEANATLGLARAGQLPAELDQELEKIQADLFTLGAELACDPEKVDRLKLPLLGQERIAELEQLIDRIEAELPPLKHFILPGGSPAAAALHLARTVCRRAERRVLDVADTRAEVVVYLNRLSDLLFVLARRANQMASVADIPWEGKTVS
jgi:cob(I)alamin adenosyltransferase